MRIPSLLVVLGALALTGCDGAADDDFPGGGDASARCSDIGLAADGTMTAAVGSDSFAATCFQVQTIGQDLYVVGSAIAFGRDGSITRQGEITLIVADSEIGTTEITEFSGSSHARYTTPSGSDIEAVSGSITLTEFSGSRARGTFEFTTVNGVEVRSGAFSVVP